MIPSADILGAAMSVIGSQTIQYFRFKERTLQPNGILLTEYMTPICRECSFQPINRSLYVQMGLDLQKQYVNVYIERDVQDVDRDVSGDQFVFNKERYQVDSKVDWFPIDGWDALLAVRIQDA